MYTRDYQDTETVQIPSGYRGTLLDDTRETDMENEDAKMCDSTPVGGASSILPRGLRTLLGKDFLRGFKIGGEELLIIAAVLFLLLSKDGDKECAILLGLLLFIT